MNDPADRQDRMARWLREEKGPTAIALLIILLLAAGRFIPPILAGPLAVILIWLFLRAGRLGWAAIGFGQPRIGWGRTVILALAATAAIQGVTLFGVLPLLRATGWDMPDLSAFDALRGNLGLLALYLGVSWTTAGFGEEIVWRGFLMTRFARLFDDRRAAWIAAWFGTSMIFGMLHSYQGPTGILLTGWVGFLLGGLFLASGRNLWACVLTHGMIDTVSFLLLYSGLADWFG